MCEKMKQLMVSPQIFKGRQKQCKSRFADKEKEEQTLNNNSKGSVLRELGKNAKL